MRKQSVLDQLDVCPFCKHKMKFQNNIAFLLCQNAANHMGDYVSCLLDEPKGNITDIIIKIDDRYCFSFNFVRLTTMFFDWGANAKSINYRIKTILDANRIIDLDLSSKETIQKTIDRLLLLV